MANRRESWRPTSSSSPMPTSSIPYTSSSLSSSSCLLPLMPPPTPRRTKVPPESWVVPIVRMKERAWANSGFALSESNPTPCTMRRGRGLNESALMSSSLGAKVTTARLFRNISSPAFSAAACAPFGSESTSSPSGTAPTTLGPTP